ncbi:tRNA-dihydrouridine synthase [Klebsormidium nitens]|uniref:tRNA-dihydrouridine(47) synthase [NAD(P)(+)] n=1 Tax=Klebsormidium nitens TaxID=105231 RepID=A0A1Y1I3R4_KLENI|nr:tRNA-dihydrouridine synthase [Klebsormidium nitens]|eukprot:GAQ85580.1 tRNA-dihydrouridine synthase [Klebsormidium nitens]
MEEPAQAAGGRIGEAEVTEVVTVATTSHQSLLPESLMQNVTAIQPSATEEVAVKEQNGGVNGVGIDGVKPVRPPLSLEEKLARGIAPVREEFLWTPEERDAWKKERAANTGQSAEGAADGAKVSGSKLSKRAMKKARAEAKKTNVCGVVARTGNSNACTYGSQCRFSHDLTLFLEKKAADLEGPCPFASDEPCPFGVACRYATKHNTGPAVEDGKPVFRGTAKKGPGDGVFVPRDEVNSLDKDLQKRLWKQQIASPRASAALKQLGIQISHHGRQLEEEGVAGDMEQEGPSEPAHVQTKADHHIPSEALAASVAQETNGVAEPSKVEPSKAEPQMDSAGLQAGSVDGSALPLAEESGSADPAGREGTEAAEEGKRKVNGESEPTAKRAKLVENGAGTEVGPTKLWDVNGGGAEGLGVERRGKRTIDFRGKLYLAPLTTVGNLPFRRVCLGLGADITCGEMAMATNLLQGQQSEWALLRRHASEAVFGVQICGSKPDHVARAAEMITDSCSVDFVDINMGCPIDLVVNKGAGSHLLLKPKRIEQIVKCAVAASRVPVTIKVRTGFLDKQATSHLFMPQLSSWGAAAVTVHGRSRQQRYSKQADWSYIARCAEAAKGVQLIGNGDVMSFEDYNAHVAEAPELATCMIARGALVKPWLFTEIKEQRHWDISASERLDLLRQYCKFGIEHWGSDDKGVETTRRFLLEWLSYLHRYVPAGLLEVLPQKMAWRPPAYRGRSDLEIMMASDNAADWVRISEMLLGPAPAGFSFTPKHKSGTVENG